MAKDMFKCPECAEEGVDKEFGRPQALGAHRSRVHGVPGRSRSAGGGGDLRPRADTNGDGHQIDRDSLLQSLFPDGIPPREAVMQRTQAWLDDAERLITA